MDKPTFVYVTYIATSIEQLWAALTSESFTQQYWPEGLESDWQVGSPVQPVNPEGKPREPGEVLQSEPPHRLTYTVPSSPESEPSRVRFELEQAGATVKLTLIHDRLTAHLTTQSCMALEQAWTDRLSILKLLLELEVTYPGLPPTRRSLRSNRARASESLAPRFIGSVTRHLHEISFTST
jgi:uncharacterized protein YndB with AHSA1/START domain